jgi:hypothetical protein
VVPVAPVVLLPVLVGRRFRSLRHPEVAKRTPRDKTTIKSLDATLRISVTPVGSRRIDAPDLGL